LVLIDASHGVQQQSRLHGFLLNLLGIKQIVVLVNKMDLIEYSQRKFDAIRDEYSGYLQSIGAAADAVIPVSARDGDNLTSASTQMKWYRGPSVMDVLSSFRPTRRTTELPLRRSRTSTSSTTGILVGRTNPPPVGTGCCPPSNKISRVLRSSPHTAAATEAEAGQSVGIMFDDQLFVERGELASHPDHAPLETTVFRGRLFWLAQQPLNKGAEYRLRIATRDVPVTVESVERIFDVEDLSTHSGDDIGRHGVGDVILRTRAMLAVDEAKSFARTGRFVLTDESHILAGGLIDMEGYPNQREIRVVRSENLRTEKHRISSDQRAARAGHKGGVLWFTGLSGSGNRRWRWL
jgi:bifunctional enzyme CysN/CysC